MNLDNIYIRAWLYNSKCKILYETQTGLTTLFCTLNSDYFENDDGNRWENEGGALKKSLNALEANNTHAIVWNLDEEHWQVLRYSSIVDFIPIES